MEISFINVTSFYKMVTSVFRASSMSAAAQK